MRVLTPNHHSSLLQTLGDSGIIMLFTAGVANQCTDQDDLEPVASSTVRLINVAFGDESDTDLDELASETNGLTYTVETSGILYTQPRLSQFSCHCTTHPP